MNGGSEYKIVNVDFTHKFTALDMQDAKRVKYVLEQQAVSEIAQQIVAEGLGEVQKDYDISRQVTIFNTRVRVLVKKQ